MLRGRGIFVSYRKEVYAQGIGAVGRGQRSFGVHPSAITSTSTNTPRGRAGTAMQALIAWEYGPMAAGMESAGIMFINKSPEINLRSVIILIQ
jgi:hypothetical protein